MASRARGRPKKARETRMDAAVDAMKEMGFEEKLIKSTVKELLKVYGGSEAWPLIEDGHYNQLFEMLLEKNKEKQGGVEQITSKNGEGGSQLDQPEQALVLEQNPDATPEGNSEPLNDAEPPFSDVTDNASGNDNIGMEEFGGADVLVAGMEESGGADVNLDVHAMNPNGDLDVNSILPLAVLPPRPPVGTIPNPRRKPCYGWVSDEDEESDDIVYVPARLPQQPRRKTRWDIAPDEI
ncbi:WIYLD domain-containing protein [Heracleum sosnowskyi]|uniref:WIYLD domain-containing protein n=1 Tax=Heracleum sosnowskyi TaxID=360622 RepID=A0AAD8MMA8_9APIA|nr:WIYLD domain-containing protein [Heracleum sosnowskyi]